MHKPIRTTVYIGADHAGFALKGKLVPFLKKLGFSVVDKGAHRLRKEDDYPDYANAVAASVARGNAVGILVCGSAQGVGMVANKRRGIRAAVVQKKEEAVLSREHNDANVLALSGWNLSVAQAKTIVQTFLETPFSGEKRHVRRLRKIASIEKRAMK